MKEAKKRKQKKKHRETDIAYQNKDITSKLLAEYFGGKSFRVYGLDIPEVKAVLPTNIPSVRANELLDDEELMEFIILPLSFREKEEQKEKIRESVKLAAQIQDRSRQLFALAGLLTFTDKLIDMKTADQIRRMIGMTKVGWIIEQEKQQALAKAEEEKRKMLAKVEEKERALAKAEAEKRQAARECVVKMIRKNYSTEEIAFIVSDFSWNDIEAVRKEIAEEE